MAPRTEERSSSSLLCEEEAGEAVSTEPDPRISDQPPLVHLQSNILHPPASDEAAVGDLIDSESWTLPEQDYLQRCRGRSVNLTARQDSISWILKVHAHYQFMPVTALVAVNYFDRFLSAHSLLEHENGWPFQLLSVACLSLASKMEEPYPPLLLDLQTYEPKFVFEPKTVQRMELYAVANLNWRLRSITPLDFLHFFVSKIPVPSSSTGPGSSSLPSRIFSVASDLILRTLRNPENSSINYVIITKLQRFLKERLINLIDFLGFTPSAIAAAAALLAAGKGSESLLAFHERLNKEMVRSCHQLMEEYLVDTCPGAGLKDAEAEPPAGQPPSPVGVLDVAACGSCDTRSNNRGSSSASGAQPPRPNKRPRSPTVDVQEQ